MLKQDLRKYFLEKRFKLSNECIETNSLKILKILADNFILKNQKICTFFPIVSKNEIDTFYLIDLSNKIGFELFTTKWDIQSNELTVHKINSKSDLVLNEFQIPEPKNTKFIEETENISIVLIPLLCFDKNGNRVGYGKGVYDRFLSKFNNSATLFIGLSIFEPIDQIIDSNEFDVKLDFCITPFQIYQFEK